MALASGVLLVSTRLAAAEGAASTPTEIVDRQLAAYNARNVEAFLRCYAPDAELFEFPDKSLAKGTVALRERPPVSGLSLLAGMAVAAFITSVPLMIWEIASGGFIWPTPGGLLTLVYVALGPAFAAHRGRWARRRRDGCVRPRW